MALSDEDVREILRIIDESELQELRIETAGFSLYVSKDGSAPPPMRPQPVVEAAPAEPPSAPNGLVTIEAPLLGTFYGAEGPGKPPFVEVGSRVEPDTIVCIIEVMKMMNSVPAGVTGTIVTVVPDNAELVEFGQPLFRVRPA